MRPEASKAHQRRVLQVAFAGAKMTGGNRRTGSSDCWIECAEGYALGPAVPYEPGKSSQYDKLDAAWAMAYAEQHAKEPELMAKAEQEVERQQIRALLDFAIEEVA